MTLYNWDITPVLILRPLALTGVYLVAVDTRTDSGGSV